MKNTSTPNNTTRFTPTPATLTPEQMAERLAQLEAENARLTAASAPPPLTCKIGEKGGVCVYGLGRFPTTLYPEQWQRLLAPESVDMILTFIETNTPKLRFKKAA